MISAKCPNVFYYSKIPSLSIHVFSHIVRDNKFHFFVKITQVVYLFQELYAILRLMTTKTL